MLHLEIGKVPKLVSRAYHQHLQMTNVFFRIIVNLRGCFKTDLQSSNCITNVTTNSWTRGILKYSRMHLSERKISLMLGKTN